MKAFRTISVLFLAMLVLISSTSFMVGVHFCMGEIQDVAIFSKAKPCAMEQQLPPCHRHAKKSCCKDESIIHKGEDFKASASQLHFEAPLLISIEAPVVLISEIIPTAPGSRIQHYNYDPPLRSCDLTVAHQVFLI